jgi:hypothetical protein
MNTNTDYAALYYADISKDLKLLEKNVHDYPASSVARFLLLYHLKKNNDPRFNQEAKQVGIYLHNPYWMEFQLSKLQQEEKEIAESISIEKTESEVAEPFTKSISINEENESNAAVAETKRESDSPVVEESNEEETPFEVNEQISENLPPEVEAAEAENEELLNESKTEVVNENNNEIIEQPVQEELPLAVNEQNKGNLSPENETAEEESIDLTERTNEEAILNNELVEVPAVEEAKENFAIEENLHGPELEKESELNSSPEEEANFNKEESVLNIKVPDEEQNSSTETIQDEEDANEEEDDTILFEPLHTVDYFASQGIRLTQEALNNDQLGRQVKSFTAWLKSMKKLHPGQLPEQNEVIEKLIQTSSEVSNQNANVLTEAMAEVLVKQGKREKAIEMYQKLSLINPSKSPYFAAKIESLKII